MPAATAYRIGTYTRFPSMRTQDTYIEADSCTSALTATASTGRRPRISEHEMAGPGPSSQEARSSDSSRPAFEPCLFEPESLFPGNRILCGETKATKHPEKFTESRGRDEAHVTTRPIRRQLPHGREISSAVGMRGGPFRTKLGTGVLPFPPQ